MLPMDGAADGACAACVRRTARARPAKKAAAFTQLSAHPTAQALMGERFFWAADDGMTPLGNAVGKEVFPAFRTWRQHHPDGLALACLGELLTRWNVEDAGWDVEDAAEVERAVRWGLFDLITRDDVVVALAFAQLVLEGLVDGVVRKRALQALVRQRQSSVVTARGWSRAEEWLRRSQAMQDVLSRA